MYTTRIRHTSRTMGTEYMGLIATLRIIYIYIYRKIIIRIKNIRECILFYTHYIINRSLFTYYYYYY